MANVEEVDLGVTNIVYIAYNLELLHFTLIIKKNTCRISSQVAFGLGVFLIPFSIANFCHLVSGLGVGNGFSRGKLYLGSGKSTYM